MTHQEKDGVSVTTDKEYFLDPLSAKLVRDHVFRIVILWGTIVTLLFGFGGYSFLSMWRSNIETNISSELRTSISKEIRLEAEKDIEKFTTRMEEDLKLDEKSYKELLVNRLADSLQEAAGFAKRTEDDSKKISIILEQAWKADQDLKSVRDLLNEIEKNKESIAKVLLEDPDLKFQLISKIEKVVSGGLIWKPLVLTGSWKPYLSGYHEPSYALSSSGRVYFRGLIKVDKPPAEPLRKDIQIAQLPAELAPSHRSLLSSMSGGNIVTRIDVTNESILMFMEGHLGWVSLDNLSYSIKQTEL